MIQRCAIALVFATAGATFGQTAPEAIIAGRVTDSVTHQPVAGVLVSAGMVHAETAGDGTYSLTAPLKPEQGKVLIDAKKSGYGRRVFGEWLTVTAGEVTKFDFEIDPAATVSGRLTDRDSDAPLAGFAVHLTPGIAINVTDADGRFTLKDVLPGEYVLEVNPSKNDTGYASTWYPGVPRVDMAAKIALNPGSGRIVDVRLRKGELRSISGSVRMPRIGTSKEDVNDVNYALRSLDGGSFIRREVVSSGKPFRFDAVADGSYSLMLSVGKSLYAQRTIEIRGRDIEDLVLTMQPGIAIKAEIVLEEKEAKPPPVAKSGFNLSPLDGWQRSDLPVDEDPSRAEGMPRGRYWPHLAPIAGFAVTSVSYGNQDVTDQAIDIESDSTVTFTLTSHPGSIAGVVRDSDSKPVSDVLVLLFPETLPDSVALNLLDRMAFTSSDGGARFPSLAPGKYRLTVLPDADPMRMNDSAFLREAFASAETVTAEAGQTTTVFLRAPK